VQGLCKSLDEEIWDIPAHTELWRHGTVQNFDYLMYLNFVSHRSFNDPAQYPIMPWVLSDYKNDRLDYKRSTLTFRDLSKPVGALSSDKLEQFKAKYFEIMNKSSTIASEAEHLKGEKPYMYLSHYSTAGIVLYYLIRRFPQYILKVQNEGFGGPADRIFYDIGMSWRNCLNVLSDNKELIPEFFFGDGSFLKNIHSVELGLNHKEEKVDDVTLPPWAKSHQDFILQNRAALESNQVSATLSKWIDLVFGELQAGEKASIANNLFQPSTYEENMEFKGMNPLELEALEAQIKNFGQTPLQLFENAQHPTRDVRMTHLLGVGSHEEGNQDLKEAREEIQRQKRELELTHALNEENLVKQMQEFQALDDLRKKKLDRYREENEKQVEKYRALIEHLKTKNAEMKLELEEGFKEKENQYKKLIESL